MSEPVRAGGTHGLGFPYQDGAEGRGAPGLIRWARACRMIRWIVNVMPTSYFPACCLTAASRDGQGSQPSCVQTILPEAETRANQGWSWTW
jgi:hypothetical protein